MIDKTRLAREGLRAALEVRRSQSIPREWPLNIYDLSTNIGVDIRFMDAPSLEGMFVRDPGPRIILPSFEHRPRGRVAYSCAHELGHHRFSHGTQADRYWEDGRESDIFMPHEWLADVFAGYLLMPRQAVLYAFEKRGWSGSSPTPLQAFTVAGELGVGYDALLKHMCYALELISHGWHSELARSTPKSIRSSLVRRECGEHLALLDESWSVVPVDLEVGDLLLAPDGALPPASLFREADGFLLGGIFQASHTGTGIVRIGGHDVELRISRKHYVGPFTNRFIPDPDEH